MQKPKLPKKLNNQQVELEGWVILPSNPKRKKSDIESSVYQTLFREEEYLREFKRRWRHPRDKIVKAKLIIG